ncbi:hypothetical protein EDB81DRAFT_865021, partial [Dactylonectria macrodidyma]
LHHQPLGSKKLTSCPRQLSSRRESICYCISKGSETRSTSSSFLLLSLLSLPGKFAIASCLLFLPPSLHSFDCPFFFVSFFFLSHIPLLICWPPGRNLSP